MNTYRKPWYMALPIWAVILIVGALFLTAIMGSLLLYSTVRAGGLFRSNLPTATATAIGSPSIELSVTEGSPGTLISVTGANWSSDDTVVLSLDDPADGRAPAINPEGLVGVAKPTVDGHINESFVYPSEARWTARSRVFVVARSQSSGRLATAEFRLLAATATALPTATTVPPVVFPTALPSQTAVPACTDKVGFVADVTIPDSTNMEAGRSFTKTWRLRNVGTCTWLPSYNFVFSGGSSMGGASVIPLGKSVSPGETVDFSVALKAPSAAGTYRGNWMLRNTSGGTFGLGANANQPFWVQIIVGPVGSTVDGTWKGEYFTNRDLSGTPRVRQDVIVDFNWGRGKPMAEIPADDFSVRWTGKANFDAATYRFKVLADDGVRLWVDNVLVLDQWKVQSATEHSVDVALAKGSHTIRLEYFERSHDARVRLRWERQSGSSFAEWKAEYFANRDLSGTPVLVRNDRIVDYNWRDKSPAVGVPADNFSVRWTRKIDFQSGMHSFIVRADDGVRVFVDGQRIINEWHDSSGKQEYVVDMALSGQKTVVVEYFERGGNALIAFDIELLAPTATPTATATSTPTPISVPTETPTEEPSPGPTPTATPTIELEGALSQVLDLGEAACTATWQNDRGEVLACPRETEGDAGGVLVRSTSRLEDGSEYQGPALEISVGSGNPTSVTGSYPARQFAAGERFRARIGCSEAGTDCRYVYRLGYRDSDGGVHAVASWVGEHDGITDRVDVDLASLAGRTVALILEVESRSEGITSPAIWVRPRIVR
ncbi:MAG: PA14 domain-containing protein [Anaerolineales bacterium]|nr:PA14 domain-containing protein [Anaerolineales bacterium]